MEIDQRVKQPAVSIRLTNSAEEREEVFRLRYEIYIEEMGWKSACADHARRMLEQPLDASGAIWIAVSDGKIVGSLRVNYGTPADLDFYADAYDLHSFLDPASSAAIVTNFVIHRAYRNLSVAMQLVRATCAFLLGVNVGLALLDCEPGLTRFYKWLGFEVHKQDFVHPHYGPGICMRMDVMRLRHRYVAEEASVAA